MAAQAIENPFPTFTGLNGQPLSNGYVYFGEPDQDPREYPMQVYYDEALTIPVIQPLRTNAGYLYRNGSPTNVWVNGTYSVLVLDSTGRQVYYYPEWTAASSENISFIQAGSGAVLRSAQSKMRETVTLKDFGAVGDGVANDSNAFSLALASAKEIVIGAGTYLLATEVAFAAGDKVIRGEGGTLVRGAALGAGSALYAQGKSNITLTGNCTMTVQAGTPHTQVGYFARFESCDDFTCNGWTFNSAIPGASSNKESLEGHLFTQFGNRIAIYGNRSLYSSGNAFGAHGDGVAGVNGHDVLIAYNLIYNALDTGIGLFTGCHSVTVVGNVMVRDDYSTAYNNVGIDVAGCYGGTISGNTFNGGVIGLRYLSNLIYTNQRVEISGNTFEGQVAGISAEPPTCIKVDHNDGTASSQAMDLFLKNNIFKVSSGGVGVNMVSRVTNQAFPLTFQIDGNTFDQTATSSIGVYFQHGNAVGYFRAISGKNTFTAFGAGSVAAAFVGPLEKKTVLDQTLTASQLTKTLTAYAGAGPETVNFMNLSPGVYATCAALGTCTTDGAGSVLYLKTRAGVDLPQNKVINGASSDTTIDGIWNAITVPGVYKFEMGAGSGTCTTPFEYLSAVKII